MGEKLGLKWGRRKGEVGAGTPSLLASPLPHYTEMTNSVTWGGGVGVGRGSKKGAGLHWADSLLSLGTNRPFPG